jgi:predicted nicotinamide N-methyase
MYLTDIHEPTLENLRYNVTANGLNLVDEDEAGNAAAEEAARAIGEATVFRAPAPAPVGSPAEGEEQGEVAVVVKCVNWQDPASYPSEPADVVIGSDLVYDDNILTMLVPALARILKEGAPKQLLPYCDILHAAV